MALKIISKFNLVVKDKIFVGIVSEIQFNARDKDAKKIESFIHLFMLIIQLSYNGIRLQSIPCLCVSFFILLPLIVLSIHAFA
jgi:hypothetical protein